MRAVSSGEWCAAVSRAKSASSSDGSVVGELTRYSVRRSWSLGPRIASQSASSRASLSGSTSTVEYEVTESSLCGRSTSNAMTRVSQ